MTTIADPAAARSTSAWWMAAASPASTPQVGWLTTTPRVRQQVVGFELSDYEYIVGISNPVKGPELNECPASWTANGLKQVGTMKERFRLSVLLDGEQVAHLE